MNIKEQITQELNKFCQQDLEKIYQVIKSAQSSDDIKLNNTKTIINAKNEELIIQHKTFPNANIAGWNTNKPICPKQYLFPLNSFTQSWRFFASEEAKSEIIFPKIIELIRNIENISETLGIIGIVSINRYSIELLKGDCFSWDSIFLAIDTLLENHIKDCSISNDLTETKRN